MLGTKRQCISHKNTRKRLGPPLSHKKKSDEEFHDWSSDSAASAAEEEATAYKIRRRQRSEGGVLTRYADRDRHF